MRVLLCPVDLGYRARRLEINDRRSLCLKLSRRTGQKQIAYLIDARVVGRDPRRDKIADGRAGRRSRGELRRWQ
jgi:hypothetical protein